MIQNQTAEKIIPSIYPSQQIGSSGYYSASEFRKLAQADLKRLLKKHGRI